MTSRNRVVVASVGVATPRYVLRQQDARGFAGQFFAKDFPDVDRLLRAFDHTGIEARQLVAPLDWYRTPHDFPTKNALYCREVSELAKDASRSALASGSLRPRDIGAVVFVSSTGVSTPSLDVALIEALGMRRDTVRVPLWGLGCAGGAAGLARGMDLCRALTRPVLVE